MSGSCESSVAQVSNIKSVETWAALGCCIDSETGPASINKLSPHSAGGCVVKGVLVPACKDVEEKTPARSSAKEEFGEISAASAGLELGVRNGGRLVLPLWVSAETLRFYADMVVSTGRWARGMSPKRHPSRS